MNQNPTKLSILCECGNCGHTCDASELNTIRHISLRIDLPEDHPDAIMPDGECPKCGCLSYAIDESMIALPLSIQPCADDHGETTLIVDAKGFSLAAITSAAWDPDAALEYPQDRAYANLIVGLCNALPEVKSALRNMIALAGEAMAAREDSDDEDEAVTALHQLDVDAAERTLALITQLETVSS